MTSASVHAVSEPGAGRRDPWDVPRLVELLLACGRVALAAQREAAWTLKSDGTLVTRVDHAVEALLADRLERPAAGHYLIGEETVATRDEAYVQAALAQTAWIVDPIDGTAPFAHGLSSWGTSIGLAQAGVLVHGAVILPARRELLVTVGDEVWWASDVDCGESARPPALARLEPRVLPMTDGGMLALGQRFCKTGTLPWPNPVTATGCALDALGYLMLGRLMGCIGWMKLWDVAGVLPMLARTGVVARLADGAPLSLDLAAGAFVLAAGRPDRWAQRSQAGFGSAAVVDAMWRDGLLASTPAGWAGAGSGARGGAPR